MARKKMTPDDVLERVIAVVNQFNEENVEPAELDPLQKFLQKFGAPSQVEIGHRYGDYVARFRGAYLYMSNQSSAMVQRLCNYCSACTLSLN